MSSRTVTGSPLSDTARASTVQLLQSQLVDLLDLSLQAKQAHWNVVGPAFKPVHEHLDEIHGLVLGFSDTVAERINALGHWPNGQHGDLAKATSLAPMPSGPIRDQDAIHSMASRLGAVLARTRERSERCSDLDPVSEDLLIGISSDLEKQLWMLDVQRA